MIVHDKAKKGQKERWRISVSYKDSMGVNRRKWATAHSLKEAKEKEASLTIQLKDPDKFEKMTMDDLFDRFIEFCKKNKKKTTVSNYTYNYRLLKKYFGQKDVRRLNVTDFEKWKDQMNNSESFKLSTKRLYFALLRAILNFAKIHYGINAVGNLDKVGQFKKDRNVIEDEDESSHMKFWTEDQFSQFVKSYDEEFQRLGVNPNHWDGRFSTKGWTCTKMLAYLCFYAGLRRGEANALYISDFHDSTDDGGKAWINVSKSVEFLKKPDGTMEWVLSTTKNESSKRKVPIPELLAVVIRKHIIEYSSKVDGDGSKTFLLGGKEPVQYSVMDYIFRQVISKAELPRITIHGLRHSYVSFLINNHVPLETISRLVGHSTPTLTWKVYSHLYPETLTDAIDIFDKK